MKRSVGVGLSALLAGTVLTAAAVAPATASSNGRKNTAIVLGGVAVYEALKGNTGAALAAGAGAAIAYKGYQDERDREYRYDRYGHHYYVDRNSNRDRDDRHDVDGRRDRVWDRDGDRYRDSDRYRDRDNKSVYYYSDGRRDDRRDSDRDDRSRVPNIGLNRAVYQRDRDRDCDRDDHRRGRDR